MFQLRLRASLTQFQLSLWPTRMNPDSHSLANATQTTGDYPTAVAALNSLQSNVAQRSRAIRDRGVSFGEYNLAETTACLRSLDVGLEQLDALRIIHVSGTKGKGSTCAFVESILRANGKRTGFYSSPHLEHVNERIRLNGEPIDCGRFASYFWTVYSRLLATCGSQNGRPTMPPYFTFLTVMALYVFLQEQVDVAIVEVGIGGQGDATNVVRNPVVCGITTLDYDHQSLLGDTLSEIAWQKGGIFKRGSVAVTVAQESECMAVFAKRAQDVGCLLYVTATEPCAQSYSAAVSFTKCEHSSNLILAVHLADIWLNRLLEPNYTPRATGTFESVALLQPFDVLANPSFRSGLSSARWPGRNQVVKTNCATVYLDGAHTPKSMRDCAEWFSRAASDELRSTSPPVKRTRILVFNCTADRNASVLLKCLFKLALATFYLSY